ncbi:hypothetical protein AN9206.2 [Paecilomyces variotii No. 5]|uniref:Uncharacterized protein n=1 Tax=Byssochlamys spectabilis (strain No. 5 / NBRC 109023) TaxID=1356009 RepID=V5FIE4_BYSSN|nr:hypothetical protein AN9206.2 [Paecilomyces variotii No. 5]
MGKEAFINQLESSDEFKVLDRVANHDATVDEALQKVVDMTVVATTVHGPNSLKGAGLVDYNVALAILELSQRLEPAKHGKLVEFISKLQKRTATDPLTGEPQKIQGDTLWTDLPSLGFTELETWYEFGGEYKGKFVPSAIALCHTANQIWYYLDPCDPKMDPKEKQRWANLNAFIAQLSQAAEVNYADKNVLFHPLDKSLRGIWTLQKALENGDHPPETLVGTAALRAAALWFIYAADRLWANVKNGRTYPEASGAGPGSQKYAQQGWKGFEEERWNIWAKGLQDAKAASTDEEEKALLEDALSHIKRATESG